MTDGQLSDARFQLRTAPVIGGAMVTGMAGGLLALAATRPGGLRYRGGRAAAVRADGRSAHHGQAGRGPGRSGGLRRR